MRKILVILFLLLMQDAGTAFAASEQPAAKTGEKPNVNLYIPPEAAKAEETYNGLFKNLTDDQRDIIKAYESDYAKTSNIELEIASTALKIKHCSQADNDIAKDPGKYRSFFNAYSNQLKVQQRDERLKIRARQIEETSFLDPEILDRHFDYTSNVVFQIGVQVIKMNYDKGKFAETDCAALTKQLEEASLKGNPIAGVVETAPDKVFEIQRLAKAADPEGMYLLGMLQLTGNGVAKDPKQGLLMLKRAAEKGHERAQLILGVGLTTDMFGQPDLQEARYWLEKAALQGNKNAESALDQLDKQ